MNNTELLTPRVETGKEESQRTLFKGYYNRSDNQSFQKSLHNQRRKNI